MTTTRSGLTAIAAVARNDVIGVGQQIPWRIPEDWLRFKEVTMGGVLIMGRKTFESIGRVLPGRTTVIVSRSLRLSAPTVGEVLDTSSVASLLDQAPSPHSPEPGRLPPDVALAASLDEALAIAGSRLNRVYSGQTFIAGGAEIYRLAWPLLTDLDLTRVDQSPEGGTAFFPKVDPAEWDEIERVPRDGYAFVKYRRRGLPG